MDGVSIINASSKNAEKELKLVSDASAVAKITRCHPASIWQPGANFPNAEGKLFSKQSSRKSLVSFYEQKKTVFLSQEDVNLRLWTPAVSLGQVHERVCDASVVAKTTRFVVIRQPVASSQNAEGKLFANQRSHKRLATFYRKKNYFFSHCKVNLRFLTLAVSLGGVH